jgi:RNA polymerase sigma-70 factor (ECF subfamily)
MPYHRGKPRACNDRQCGVQQGIIHKVEAEPAARDQAHADVDLVLRAASGDRHAFAQLVEPRLDRMFRTACAVLGSEADARDATQEAFTSAWVNLPRLRQPDRFDAWLHRVLVNRCRDALRRRRHRAREVPIDDLPLAAVGRDDPALGSGALGAAFATLTLDQRQLLVQHHLFHQPLAEIAKLLGIPVGTVKWRMHAARRALERAMETNR